MLGKDKVGCNLGAGNNRGREWVADGKFKNKPSQFFRGMGWDKEKIGWEGGWNRVIVANKNVRTERDGVKGWLGEDG